MTNTKIEPIKFNKIYIHNLEKRHIEKYPDLFTIETTKTEFQPRKVTNKVETTDTKTGQIIIKELVTTMFEPVEIKVRVRKPYLEFKCEGVPIVKFKDPKTKLSLTLHYMNSTALIDGEFVGQFYTK